MIEYIIEDYFSLTLTSHPNYPLDNEYYEIYCKILPKYLVNDNPYVDNFLLFYKDPLVMGIDILYYYCAYHNNQLLLEKIIKIYHQIIPSFGNSNIYNPIQFSIKNGFLEIFKILYNNFHQYDFLQNINSDCIKICITNGHLQCIKHLNDIYKLKFINHDFLYYYLSSKNIDVLNYILEFYSFQEIYEFLSNNKLFFNRCIINNYKIIEFYINFQYPLFIDDVSLSLMYHYMIVKPLDVNKNYDLEFEISLFKKILNHFKELYQNNFQEYYELILRFFRNHFYIDSHISIFNTSIIKIHQILFDIILENQIKINTQVENTNIESQSDLFNTIGHSIDKYEILKNNEFFQIYFKQLIVYKKYQLLFYYIDKYENVKNFLKEHFYYRLLYEMNDFHLNVICNDTLCVKKIKNTSNECIILGLMPNRNEEYFKCIYNHVLLRNCYNEYLQKYNKVYDKCLYCGNELKKKIYIYMDIYI